jgi:predicted enzyme related to lactoylglutathione lyase
VFNWSARHAEAIATLGDWHAEGKLKLREDARDAESDGRVGEEEKAMRAVIVAMAIGFATAAAWAESPKSHPVDVAPGRVAWFDITTSNLAKSEAFYGKLFGWEFAPVKGTDLAVQIVAGDAMVGTLRVAEGPISAFNGVVYIQVADIEASCAKAKELGGTVPPGFPFNLPDGTGAVGLVADPVGHPVGMYSRAAIPSTTPAVK